MGDDSETRARLAALGEDLCGTDWHSQAFAAWEQMSECLQLATTTDHGDDAGWLAANWLRARQDGERFILYVLMWLLVPEDIFTLEGALREHLR